MPINIYKKSKIGLIVGKFAPLHKGHQFLIETAIKKMDRVIVLVYRCPKEIKIPLKKRAEWIRTLYPSVKVIEGWSAPTEKGNDPDITKKNINYIKHAVHLPVTHVFSSEKYGKILSQALNAKNIIVDKKRQRFPISATQIRTNPKKYKKFLEPMIYQEIIKTTPY